MPKGYEFGLVHTLQKPVASFHPILQSPKLFNPFTDLRMTRGEQLLIDAVEPPYGNMEMIGDVLPATLSYSDVFRTYR